MKTYNVLSREQSVHKHAVLEASAGTGKTYTIENIVSRLLIESGNFQEPLTIDKILVVTFTRAATRELKDRIRSKLVNNLTLLKSNAADAPDYLVAVMERGPEAVKKAIFYIEQALMSFDFAQIFTIHGFCWRMLKNHALEAHISLEATCKEEQSMDSARLQRAVRDFLRTGLKMPSYTPQQLKMLVSQSRKDSDALATSLLNEVTKGIEIVPPCDDEESLSAVFCRVAADCQKFLKHFQDQEEMIGHSDLLQKMLNAVSNNAFADKIRQMYSAVIVDEFQDTDPVQWEIFSRLFVNEKNPWNGFMTLVGDPKQSIYAFRQADIYTYLSAAKKFGPESQATLNTNYRSVPLLVDAINALFKSGQGLFTLPRLSLDLPYQEVKAGIASTETEEPCLQFWTVELEGKGKLTPNKIEADYFFPAIANEILRLQETQGIPLSSHAILVATNHQAKKLISYLKGRGIAVKAYKGKDLSSSSAVPSMRELLNGILNYHSRSPLNTALSGKIIGMAHSELSALKDEERMVAVLTQCDSLRNTLHAEGFAKFYQQFMQTSWHEDNKSVIERLLETSDGYEFYRQWQDLADLLIKEEYEQDLLPFGLLSYLDNLENSSQDDEDSQSYIDLQKDGVSVLTTFVSKGLEFDIVYALSMVNTSKNAEDHLFPVHDGTKYYLKAAKNRDDPLYRAHCEEADAEKIRRLYVALTRAKHKIYVPAIISKNRKAPIGTASPIDLLLAKMKCPNSYTDLYSCIESEDGSTLKALVSKYPDLMKLTTLSSPKSDESVYIPPKTLPLTPPPSVTIPTSELFIQSYSSLVVSKTSSENTLEMSPPHDFGAYEKNEHSLPSGNQIGILLHSIFENLPFQTVKGYNNHFDFMEVILPFVAKTPFALWKEIIARIVYNALTTPLPGSDPAFCLADVHPENTYRETEFVFPYDPEALAFDSVKIKPGFLKGVIDLFFQHKDKFYLVDWKSNWLGPTQDNYGKESLEDAMNTNRYDVQAAVYMRAMKSYLRLFDPRSFDQVFGGTYYIFLRGIGPERGILHLPPTYGGPTSC